MQVSVCDGCEKKVDLEEAGLVKKVQYCKKCKRDYDEYIRRRDELHTKLAERWVTALDLMDEVFLKTHKALPDA